MAGTFFLFFSFSVFFSFVVIPDDESTRIGNVWCRRLGIARVIFYSSQNFHNKLYAIQQRGKKFNLKFMAADVVTHDDASTSRSHSVPSRFSVDVWWQGGVECWRKEAFNRLFLICFNVCQPHCGIIIIFPPIKGKRRWCWSFVFTLSDLFSYS